VLASLIDVVIYLIIFDAILSWFMGDHDFPKSLTASMLDPLYRPVRKITGGRGGLDFSPIILIVVLSVLQSVVS